MVPGIHVLVLSLAAALPLEKEFSELDVNQVPGGYPASIWEINRAAGILDDTLSNETIRAKRQVVIKSVKWPGNTLYYFFDSSFGSYGRTAVQKAHKYISDRTCVNFVENAGAPNRVRVIGGAGVGCLSFIGMGGGQQDLHLGNGCERVGTAAHEFMHALGMHHTAQRPDRDTYVTVNMGAVSGPLASNLNKYSTTETLNYVPYEYGSVMHYSSNALGANSIIAKESKYTYTMGAELISFYDIKMINDHYGCTSKCGAGSAQCKNGGAPNPRNCATCNCPFGYGGTLCDQRPETGCGETLTASSDWQSKQYTFGEVNNNLMRYDFSFCNHWITAPAGQKVQVKITQLFNIASSPGCPNIGIEIKLSNPQMTNPRYCTPDVLNKEFTSELNPTPIIGYNKVSYSTFKFEYRAVGGGSTNPGPGTGSCVDTSQYCANWIANGNYCASTFYTTETKRSTCAKSCNLCAAQCVDADARCANWIANGNFCASTFYTVEYKKQYCAASCQMC